MVQIRYTTSLVTLTVKMVANFGSITGKASLMWLMASNKGLPVSWTELIPEATSTLQLWAGLTQKSGSSNTTKEPINTSQNQDLVPTIQLGSPTTCRMMTFLQTI
jgi:hypothetical protein